MTIFKKEPVLHPKSGAVRIIHQLQVLDLIEYHPHFSPGMIKSHAIRNMMTLAEFNRAIDALFSQGAIAYDPDSGGYTIIGGYT